METQTEIIKEYKYLLNDEQISFELDSSMRMDVKKYYTEESLSLLHSLIDHTSLNSRDNEESVTNFVNKLKKNISKSGIEEVAAVCIFPKYINKCKELLENSNIKVACVAGGFPFVQSFKEVRELECRLASSSRVDEIDIVIPVGEVQTDDLSNLRKDLKQIRLICKDKTLKVILETGEIKSLEKIFAIAIVAMEEGADFIKTSTGKVSINATPEAVYVMAYAIKKFHEKTGKKVGIKIAGGVSSSTSAINYMYLVKQLLGEEWINPKYLRLGSSSLSENLQKEYPKLKKEL